MLRETSKLAASEEAVFKHWLAASMISVIVLHHKATNYN